MLARAHHGSVSKEQRALIEDDLKSGRLRCVVATSSLELGIDMGAVDLVVQISTPPSVASGLQRVGRAGHQVGEVSRGILYPTSRHDLVGAAVTAERMRGGLIEQLVVPANPLDVLAQQTVAAAALEPLDVEQWFDIVRRSAPFSALPRSAFDATLDLLAGRYPSDEFAELRPRLVWDRDAGTLTGRPGAQWLAVTSGGTIPDRGMFAVTLAEGVDESGGRPAADGWASSTRRWSTSRASTTSSRSAPPAGGSRRSPTTASSSRRRSASRRGCRSGRATPSDGPTSSARPSATSCDATCDGEEPGDLDTRAGSNLATFLLEQRDATGVVPTDRTLVVERFRDELGDWRIVLLSPFGRRVHAPWALAVGARILERFGIDGSVVASDDGIVARLPDTGGEPPGAELFVFEPDELDEIVTTEVGGSALFASRFRECAARALLLPRRNPGARAPLWQQRQRSAQLLEVARKYPDFPILLETARECLQDVYDLPSLAELTRRIASREVQLAEVTTERASPFAQNSAVRLRRLVPLRGRHSAGRATGGGAHPRSHAARRAARPGRAARAARPGGHRAHRGRAAASGRRSSGQGRRGRRRPAAAARARSPREDVQHRLSEGEASQLLEELRDSKRTIEVPIAGEVRWAAVEDAGRLRDALGVRPPAGRGRGPPDERRRSAGRPALPLRAHPRTVHHRRGGRRDSVSASPSSPTSCAG